MKRKLNLLFLALYLVTVPAGAFLYFKSPFMGYPTLMAGAVAGVLGFFGLACLPVVLRDKTTPANALANSVPSKTGWFLLGGFLVAMALLVGYFIATGN